MDANGCNKVANKYVCEPCDYMTSRKSSIDKHLLSTKHSNRTNFTIEKQTIDIFQCKTCDKIYKVRNSLWYHEKKCKNTNPDINILLDASSNEIKMLTNLVLEVVKSNVEVVKSNHDLQLQNQELQKQMLEVCKNSQPNNTTINNSNSNNKTFNLQFFLNEQCKDAMNISDFVNSFQLKLEDLEKVGEQGYVNGMSNIIIEKLKETDIYKRPFHCSDAKRETLYVKDINGWEREGAENAKMIKAVKDVGQKNFTILNDYRLLHPECVQADSAYNDKYVHMMIQAAGSHKDNVTKVIKKITKEVVIDKNNSE